MIILVGGIVLRAKKACIGFYAGSIASSLVEAKRTRKISQLAENWAGPALSV